MAKKKEDITPEDKMEKNEKHNDGTMSGLTKTIIGTVGTIVTAAGAWAVSFFGSGKKEEKPQQRHKFHKHRLAIQHYHTHS